MRMNANIGDALVKGTGPAVDAFDRLGISMQTINGMKPEKQFELIVKQLAQVPNLAERSALAMDLFGKQGPKILKIAENLDEVNKKMEKMGLIISPEQQAALDLAGDKLDGLIGTIGTGWKKAVASIAPYIIAVVDAIDKAIVSAGGLDAILAKVGATLRFAMNVLLIMGMVKATQLLVLGIQNAGKAFMLFNALVKRSPLFLLVGAAAALATYFGVDVVGAVDKWLGVSEGLDGAYGQIAQKAEEIKKQNEATGVAVEGLNKEQQKYLEALQKTIDLKKNDVQLQEDILRYGQEEAQIRKALNDEDLKALEKKIPLNNEEYQAKRNSLEVALRSEATLKRQIQLQKEQNDLIFEATASATGFGKEIEKRRVMRLSFESGKTMDEIRREEEKRLIGAQGSELNVVAQNMALNAQQNRINKEIKNELGKYDALYSAEAKYLESKNTLYELQFLAEKDLTIAQKQSINDALRLLDKEYEDEKYRAKQANADRIYQLELNNIQRILEANKSGIAQAISAEQQAVLQKQGEAERQKAIATERIAFEKKSEAEKYAFGIDQAAQMFTALGAQNKKAFEAAKAFNIANAIMNTYMAATKALATYPPPFNFIAMAAAIGMGMAQVAAIRSQQYSGRALGGPVMGGQSYIVGENGPELFTPNTTGSITRNSDLGGGGNVNVNFSINAVDTTGFDELLISRRGLITQVISDAMTEKGQRGL
jgi:hypothetical protein